MSFSPQKLITIRAIHACGSAQKVLPFPQLRFVNFTVHPEFRHCQIALVSGILSQDEIARTESQQQSNNE
jgi:hypothetical protein